MVFQVDFKTNFFSIESHPGILGDAGGDVQRDEAKVLRDLEPGAHLKGLAVAGPLELETGVAHGDNPALHVGLLALRDDARAVQRVGEDWLLKVLLRVQ